MPEHFELSDDELHEIAGGWASMFQTLPEFDANIAFNATTPPGGYPVKADAGQAIQTSKTSIQRGMRIT